jgi:quinolinate synthase
MDLLAVDKASFSSGYLRLPQDELDRRIRAARASLGASTIVLGHHYQREEVIRHADVTGDSLKLSQHAAARTDARFIVFCGVHFMAESADILAAPHQSVLLPDLKAGCSMADMADADQVRACWSRLAAACGPDTVLPVTYMNSSADIKAFCGENAGIVCTSSNAGAVFRWAFERRPRLLFLPDEHLGRNTGVAHGIPLDAMAVYDPDRSAGGLTDGEIRRARVILWKGFCSVHQRFTVEQIERARAQNPGVRVIVHPECTHEVVRAADESGSTERIARRIDESPEGSVWAVGTEINLVMRLAARNPGKTIVHLDDCVCFCSTMFRIDPPHLCWALESLVAGRPVNVIRVPDDTKRAARAALQRMLDLPPGP